MTATREQQLVADDGTSLFTTDWLPSPSIPVTGSILLMHGLGEHAGRYTHVIQFFNCCGLVVRSYDHRGHGRSGGSRGDVPGNDTLLRDAKIVLDDFVDRHAATCSSTVAPLLFGHSMGGLFAARFAVAGLSPLRGLILSSPGLALPLSRFQMFLLKLMSVIAPGVSVPNGLSIQHLSHDPTIAEAYRNDPLVHNKISARLLNSMLHAGEYALDHAHTLSIPTLLLVAGDDRLVMPEGARRFFKALNPVFGTLYEYDKMYHEIFNEVESERVFGDLQHWLIKQQMLQPRGMLVQAH